MSAKQEHHAMIKLIQSAVMGQYGAALSMLAGSIERADRETWLAPVAQFPFWHVAYHTLYYADLYLSPNEQAHRPQPFHLPDYNFLGPQSWAPDKKFVADRPYDKNTLAAYAETCRAKAKVAIPLQSEADLAGPSGFSWLNFTRLELHLYNIRHIQHHTGQLTAALRRRGAEGTPWVGSAP
jgi:hypothetical protein